MTGYNHGLRAIIDGLQAIIHDLWAIIHGLWTIIHGLRTIIHGVWAITHGLGGDTFPTEKNLKRMLTSYLYLFSCLLNDIG